MVFVLVSWLIQCLLVLLSVAFFTLFERKVMGLFHGRVGPNKVSFVGLVQPLLDAFKLLSKQNITPLRSNKVVYNFSPQFSLVLSIFIWVTMPLSFIVLYLGYSFLIFYAFRSVMVFFILMAGWSSNSKYSLIGSLRSIAQSISYEAVISTMVLIFCFLIGSYSISRFSEFRSILFIYLFCLWFVCVLAESHRAPFDFRESESELVSGFNTEYSGAYFAFFFLSEYSMLLYSCFMMVVIFFRFIFYPVIFHPVVVVLFAVLFSFIFIWVRVTFCRFRYDLLIILAWKVLLPLALNIFVVIIVVCFY